MIIIAIGANLESPKYGLPLQTCQKALSRLEELGVEIVKQSRWLKTAPVPVSDAPWYVNAVAQIKTDLKPDELLKLLHSIENEFGRVRPFINAPRILDLDIIAYNDFISSPGDHLVVPHPRMHERAFVLLPLMDIDEDWLHPVIGKTAKELSLSIPVDQETTEYSDSSMEN
ncbi:2-amino-4-hydroxy-6-hydroxymethyldihydropteridine diphosphokinase [Kiloniella sp. EL199]|uniref:2-amino-4-hydroxy-6- hydroxymethyldihydropteridine diphosphokinase n=1 Tax=Kiloniella sp. EL199 TaxID=2107581 RepID=UPI000EA1FEDD|nr:2-amino-4-hydroxy-6-hydroxymethyldihydropteridine diphosphokinase [Kiloniella sp. EL199]